MSASEIISPRQFMLLVFLFTIGSSVLLLPTPLAEASKQNSWIAGTFALGIGQLLVWLYIVLWNRFGSLTLVEYCEYALGKWLGKLVSLLFFFHALLLTSLVVRNIGDFMTTLIIPETPLVAIHSFFLFVVIVGVRYGLETFARISELFFPWVSFLFFFMVFAVMPQVKVTNIQPVMEGGLKTVIGGALPFLGTPVLELVLFLFILPSLQQKKQAAKGFFVGTLLGGMVLILISALSILVLGVTMTTLSVYPSYVLAQKINIGKFLERIEAVLAILWMMTIFIKGTLCFYTTSLSLTQLLKLSDYRPITWPLGTLVLYLSIISYPNVAYFVTVIGKTWFPYSLTIGLFIPLLLLAAGWIKEKMGRKKPREEEAAPNP